MGFINALSCYLSLILKHSDTNLWIKQKHSRSNFRGCTCCAPLWIRHCYPSPWPTTPARLWRHTNTYRFMMFIACRLTYMYIIRITWSLRGIDYNPMSSWIIAVCCLVFFNLPSLHLAALEDLRWAKKFISRLRKSCACHMNETWNASNSTFPDTNCVVSLPDKPTLDK